MDWLKKIIIFLIISFKLSLYILNTTISSSPFIAYIYVLIILLLSLKYIITINFDKKSFLKAIPIICISFIMFFIYKEDNIFLYSLLGLLLINEDNKEIIKTIFISLIIISLLTIILGEFNILPIIESYRTIEEETQIRISLGFPNANAVFAYFIPIVLSGIYLFKNNWKFNTSLLICSGIIYEFTKCRTGFYLVLLILFFNLLDKGKLNYKLLKNSFIICFIVSILLALLFGTTQNNIINELLSYRPWYAYQFLKQGIFKWGSGIPQNLILDNLYFKILANYSIVGFFLYYYIHKVGSKLLIEDRYLFIAMIFFNIYNIFEAITIGNFVLIIFLKEIFNSYGVHYEKN